MNTRWLQLADSAFPSGGFAHSAGFEALRQLGQLGSPDDLEVRLREFAWHTAYSVLPFFNGAFDGAEVPMVDQMAEVFLSNHVAKRASSAQGRAFMLAASAMAPELEPLRALLPFSHLAVSMGVVFSRVAVPRDEARQVALFSSMRAAVSALVRLGALGPLKAQQVLWALHPHLDEVLAATVGLTVDEAASVAPLLDVAQGAHDRLYSRLFQS